MLQIACVCRIALMYATGVLSEKLPNRARGRRVANTFKFIFRHAFAKT